MLVDSDAYTRSILLSDLASHNCSNVSHIANGLALPNALISTVPDVVIFNYHYHQSEDLVLCSTVRLLSPKSSIIVIVSPGPALKAVRLWIQQTNSIDLVVEKPLVKSAFLKSLTDLLSTKISAQRAEEQTARMENLIPEAALSSIHTASYDDAEMFEAAVLFTDVRRSTELVTSLSPRAYFAELNALLSWQSQFIKKFEGSVIKYTGDGILAIFRGMGRSYLGLRCALELARHSHETNLKFGIGIAEGIVMGGFIGDSHKSGQRKQYDVIGATVHLASRLCAIANAQEVVTTKNLNAVAKLSTETQTSVESVVIRGFQKQIDCVSFKLPQLES